MASDTGTAGKFTLEHVPAMQAPGGMTKPNWRIADANDNRIATCYDETNGRAIVAALNGAPIVGDPNALAVIREQAAELIDQKHIGQPTAIGMKVAGQIIMAACDALERVTPKPGTFPVDASAFTGGPGDAGIMSQTGRLVLMITPSGKAIIDPDASPAELREALGYLAAMFVDVRDNGEAGATVTRRAHALEPDPYAFADRTFADVFDYERDRQDDRASIVVRQRVVDDVEAAHGMFDHLGTPMGLLTVRLGLALQAPVKVVERDSVEGHEPGKLTPDNATRMFAVAPRRSHGSGEPLVDVDAVKIPRPDDVLADLDKLSGEDAFRVFDRVKVLPGNTAEARDWNLMDADDVRRMIAECCAVALNTGKLPELAAAAREAVARRKG